MRIERGELLAVTVFLTLFAVFESLSVPDIGPAGSIVGIDKAYHAAFHMLYFLSVYGLSRRCRISLHSSIMVGLFSVVALGSLEEFLQSLVPGRLAEGYDLIADVAGALLGTAAVLWHRALAFRSR